MKLDKIITSALGASSVANGLPVLDNKDLGNELGKIPELENGNGMKQLHDEIHPHNMRHSRHTNEMNHHQHPTHLDEMQDNDSRHPYSAHILQNDHNYLLDEYLREIEMEIRQVKDSRDTSEKHRIFTSALKGMRNVEQLLKKNEHRDEKIFTNSLETFNHLSILYNDAKIIYEDMKKDSEHGHLTKSQLENIEEFIESHKRHNNFSPQTRSSDTPKISQTSNDFSPPIIGYNNITYPRHAQAPKKSTTLIPSPEERELKYNETHELLNKIERNFRILKNPNMTEATRFLYTNNFKSSIQKMTVIANNLKNDVHNNQIPEEIPERSRIQLERFTCLYDKAMVNYANMKNHPVYEDQNSDNIEEIDKTRSLLIELSDAKNQIDLNGEIVAYFKNNKVIDEKSKHSYYPNFRKRYEQLSFKLSKLNTELSNANREKSNLINHQNGLGSLLGRFRNRWRDVSATIHRNTKKLDMISKETIPKLNIERTKIESAIKHETSSIQWFLDQKKIRFIKQATECINKYNELINTLDKNREKRDTSRQERPTERLASTVTKAREEQLNKPLPLNNKQNTAIAR